MAVYLRLSLSTFIPAAVTLCRKSLKPTNMYQCIIFAEHTHFSLLPQFSGGTHEIVTIADQRYYRRLLTLSMHLILLINNLLAACGRYTVGMLQKQQRPNSNNAVCGFTSLTYIYGKRARVPPHHQGFEH